MPMGTCPFHLCYLYGRLEQMVDLNLLHYYHKPVTLVWLGLLSPPTSFSFSYL